MNIRLPACVFNGSTPKMSSMNIFDHMLNAYAQCRLVYAGYDPIDVEFLEYNQAFLAFARIGASGPVHLSQIIPSPDVNDKQLLDILSHVQKTNVPTRFNYYVKALDIFISASAIPTQGDHVIIFFDVARHEVSRDDNIKWLLKNFSLIIDNISEGIIITDAKRSIISINKVFTEITGYTQDDVLGNSPSILSTSRNDPSVIYNMWESVNRNGIWTGEFINRRKSGEIYHQHSVICTIKGDDSTVHGYIGILSDITHIKNHEATIKDLSCNDHLTQLPNRMNLYSWIENVMSKSSQNGKLMALLLIDLDRFKIINDNYGHFTGDQILKIIATRLTNNRKHNEFIARIGGDEFAVVLENIEDIATIDTHARNLQSEIAQPISLPQNLTLNIQASIGIAVFPASATSAEHLLRDADLAMNKAKADGRARVNFFDQSLAKEARRKLRTELRLRDAIDQNRLKLFFQPKVSITSGRIVGIEALVRWHDEEFGHISPNEFIPIAEACGLILPLGKWVLNEACRYGRTWSDMGLAPISIAVNVSPKQLRDPLFVNYVLDAIERHGFHPNLLELEITESSIVTDHHIVLPILNELRRKAIRIAIDDFGTGYSSLSYLKKLPIDILKIDRSFMENIQYSSDDKAIATAIIHMGRALDYELVGEGVETIEQLNFLKDSGCNIYQGFYFSKPIPFDDLVALHKPSL